MLAERVFVRYLNGLFVWCCCVFQKLLLDWRQHTKNVMINIKLEIVNKLWKSLKSQQSMQ